MILRKTRKLAILTFEIAKNQLLTMSGGYEPSSLSAVGGMGEEAEKRRTGEEEYGQKVFV